MLYKKKLKNLYSDDFKSYQYFLYTDIMDDFPKAFIIYNKRTLQPKQLITTAQ